MAPGLKTVAEVMRSEVDVEEVVAEQLVNGQAIIPAKKARDSNLEGVE